MSNIEKYIIDDIEQAQEFLDWLGEEKPTKDIYDNKILIGNEEFELVGKAHELVFGALISEAEDISQLPTYCELKEIEVVSDEDRIADSYTNEEIIQRIEKVKATPKEELPLVSQNKYDNNLIYGKNNTENIVSIDVKDGIVYLFKNDGSVENVPYEYWLLTHRPTKISEPLDGDLFYNYKSTYTDEEIYKKSRGVMYGRKTDFYNIYDNVESVMVSQGYTLFKGLKVSDVSVLSFDIESKGLIDDETSIPYAKNTAKVFMITNTFRDTNGKITRKMFSVDEFEDDDVAMIEAWTKWVQEIDPSIITGHNIFGYDFPYLSYCYGLRNGTKRQLELGRDCSEIVYSQKHSKFRKDGSQSYQYKNIDIFGRQIVDTFFLSIKFDFSRKYPSYGLKAIIEYEGLVKKDRQFYDAANIWKNWSIQEERDKIKAYACFAKESAKITMDNGSAKFIENVNIGDYVTTHTGENKRVYDTLVRDYSGSIYDIHLENGRTIYNVTDEHPFMTLNQELFKGEWTKVKDIKVNDFLLRKTPNVCDIPSDIIENDDFWWLFGLYQGDGYVRIQKTLKYPVFTQHQDEIENVTSCLDRLGYTYSIVDAYWYKDGVRVMSKAKDVVVSSTKLGEKLLEYSGGKFKNSDKQISKETYNYLTTNLEHGMLFVAGLYDADGNVRKNVDRTGHQASLTNTSNHLINLADIIMSLKGINVKHEFRLPPPQFSHRKRINRLYLFSSGLAILNRYLRTKHIENYPHDNVENVKFLFKVKRIVTRPYTGKVYNISVEDDNSYLVNGIISHNCDDADDALALYDLMIPQFFYYTQSIPMTLQAINNTATGRQINLFLVRSYLQEGHSIPKTTEKKQYGGGISFGVPGVHSHCLKVDLKSMYPSIILQYKVYDKDKDPKANFLTMIDFFYNVRDEYKKELKETGDIKYRYMEQSTKIFVNSAYGLLGATGLNFNSSDLADFVTTCGRNIIKYTIKWASGKEYETWI